MKKSTNKSKTMWKVINDRSNKNPGKSKQNLSLQINNTVITEPKQIANTFNSFFSSVGINPSQTGVPPSAPQNKPLGLPATNPSQNTMFLSPITPHETYKLIKNLKNKYSHGIDELPSSLLKACVDELTLPFYLLLNQSFEQGIFPDQLKRAVIKPIHKKDLKTDPNNYRPIALLPAVSKVFEKAMSNRVYSFCEKYKIFNDCQNGFRKKRSTTLAVYKYMQEVFNVLDRKEYAVGILLDMTKAYDKVLFEILLNKLYGVGIRGIAFEWFKSYLKNREQLVEIVHYNHKNNTIENVRSDTIKVNSSIPQGSVLGCLIFLIYINDLPKCIKEHCVCFADDVSLLTSTKNSMNVHTKLTTMLQQTTDWMHTHNLELNLAKTKIMTFHPYQKPSLDLNFSFHGTKLETVKEFTLLGIKIDTHINWQSHIMKLKSKLSSLTYALREIKKTTDLKTAIATYYANAHSRISYGIVLWGNSNAASDIFIMQKKFIRILANIEQLDSCKPYFIKFKILTMASVYIFEICKFVRNNPHLYKARQDIKTHITLRHWNRLLLPKSRLQTHSSSTLPMSVIIYNKIQNQLDCEQNDKIFMAKLKLFLQNKSYYSIDEFLKDK